MIESHNRPGRVKTVLLALLIGTCVFSTAYLAAWLGVRDISAFTGRHWQTRFILREMHDAIEQHHKDTGVLPTTPDAVAAIKELVFETAENGRVLDRWGNPIAYSQTGDSFDLWSYGRDGQPGGVGLDGDIHSGVRDYGDSLATLRQFAFELNTTGIFGACVASGLLAMALFYFLSRKLKSETNAAVGVLSSVFVTLIFSLFVAAGLVVLSIPSGH